MKVIAELGSNHGGSLDRALEMVRVSADCGATAVKLQKRDNRSLYTKAFYKQPYNSEHAFGDTYGEHREALELGKSDFCELIALAQELGVECFSTAFDIPSVDFLRDLDMQTIKIASGSLTDTPLITHAAKSGADLIISTGGGSLDDIQRAVEAAQGRCTGLLHCTASYPASDDILNLRCIQTYKAIWPEFTIGASLHGYGPIPGVVARVLGAEILEVHFTLDRTAKGTDNAFSLEPDGLRALCGWLKRADDSLGDGLKEIYPEELDPIKKMSKSIYTARGLEAGHVLTQDDLVLKSPGGGLPPYMLDAVLLRRLNRSLAEEEPLALSDLG